MNSHCGAGRPQMGQPRYSSEQVITPINGGRHPGRTSYLLAVSHASIRLALALVLARGRQKLLTTLAIGIAALFVLMLGISPFGLKGAWVSLLGLALGATVLGAVMIVRLGQAFRAPSAQFVEPSRFGTSHRVLSLATAAAVLPLGLAIVILPQRTNSVRADTTATAGDPSAFRPNLADQPTHMDVVAARPTGNVGATTTIQRGSQPASSGYGSGPRPTDWAQVESGLPWQPESPWLEVTPVDVSQQGSRDPARYAAVIDRFDVDGHRRYDFDHSNTYCNIFAWDVTKAMGVEIPHWYDQTTGLETPFGEGSEMSANRMDAWFDAHGAEHGWRQITADEAAAAAAAGHPTLALWRNPNPARSGHVALIRPESQPGQLLIAQAGATNFSVGRYEDVFSKITPRFFTHE